MPTGACGISCDACRLNVIGVCSSCGAGTSPEAVRKRDAQIRILGQACPILECAILNQHSYCLRDCDGFPCENFTSGPYPFSRGFLNMQARRRAEKPPVRAPYGDKVDIPPEYWQELAHRNIDELCSDAGCRPQAPEGVVLKVLNEEILVDLQQTCLKRFNRGDWKRTEDPFLELLVLVYLRNATPFGPTREMVSVHDLKDAQFFQGPHDLKIRPLLNRFGNDRAAFVRAAEKLGGDRVELADAAFRLRPFPKIPLYYLLWEGDEDFSPNLSILFDRSIERHLAADAIWGTVNMVTDALLRS
jgi:hypothetical protein